MSSAGGASVLGLSIIVLEWLEPGDETHPAPEDLVRARVIANVVWLPGAVDEEGHPLGAGPQVVRDPGARRPPDYVAGMEVVLPGLFPEPVCGRPELECAAALEEDEDLLVRRVAVR